MVLNYNFEIFTHFINATVDGLLTLCHNYLRKKPDLGSGSVLNDVDY